MLDRPLSLENKGNPLFGRGDGAAVGWAVSTGYVPYPAAVAAMEARAAAIADGTAGELVWLLEHPPLYTGGVSAKGADLIEIPVTTAEVAGRRMAAGGGGFFRLLPYAVSRWAIRQVNVRDGRPAVFYFHPWEIDPDQPRPEVAPLKSRLRHYTNLDVMAAKLSRLVHEFRWGRMDDVAAIEAARTPLKRAA
ncbi:MAG: hypothetical protein B7X78_01670 [Sphingomonadales bacterium 39-62-4]|nr:MAG: hypothetical protein B7X78_01670 [Sphingomonadales bacterium 39-62-4]